MGIETEKSKNPIRGLTREQRSTLNICFLRIMTSLRSHNPAFPQLTISFLTDYAKYIPPLLTKEIAEFTHRVRPPSSTPSLPSFFSHRGRSASLSLPPSASSTSLGKLIAPPPSYDTPSFEQAPQTPMTPGSSVFSSTLFSSSSGRSLASSLASPRSTASESPPAPPPESHEAPAHRTNSPAR